jgi:hypothetical protein
MFISPYFGGCKYTNNFLFINNIIEIQCFELLISFCKFERFDEKLLWKPTGNG